MSRERVTYVVPVNPEPWVVPPFTVGRSPGSKRPIPIAGRNERSVAFTEAVRESLREQGAVILEPPYRVHFLWWRRLEKYQSPTGRNMTRKWADSTNMQKLAEDALQGVVIENDRDNLFVTSQIVEQGVDAPGLFAVMIESNAQIDDLWIPDGFSEAELFEKVRATRDRVDIVPEPSGGNEWPPIGDLTF